jgi:hypothetical protein
MMDEEEKKGERGRGWGTSTGRVPEGVQGEFGTGNAIKPRFYYI